MTRVGVGIDSELEAELVLEEYEAELGSVLRFLAMEAQRAFRYFSTQKYGCFCGAGTVCGSPIDAIDECCRRARRGLHQGGLVNVSIDMWTPLGFRRSRAADLRLVDCVARTRWDAHWYGPAAAAYREALIVRFRLRAWIASQLRARCPYASRTTQSIPLWNVDRLVATCR